jgi:hypothetical protein
MTQNSHTTDDAPPDEDISAGEIARWIPGSRLADRQDIFADLRGNLLEAFERQPKPRKARKPTLASALRQASKAHVSVASVEFSDGKIALVLGEPDANAAEPNEWDSVLRIEQ